MNGKVTYTITVDREMFPYPPGSEVVVRYGDEYPWKKAVYCACNKESYLLHFVKHAYMIEQFRYCHPYHGNEHLIGTTYPADTPKCTKCGKAQPDCACILSTHITREQALNMDNPASTKKRDCATCPHRTDDPFGMCDDCPAREQDTATTADGGKSCGSCKNAGICSDEVKGVAQKGAYPCYNCEEFWVQLLSFALRSAPQPTDGHIQNTPESPTTADGVTVKEGDTVWHPDNGKGIVGKVHIFPRFIFHKGNGDILWVGDISHCYSRPCARLADGSVAMVGDKVWHPVYGECITFRNGNGSMETAFGTEKALRGVSASDCYPIGSRIMTPSELAAITAERDALRAELDAMKAKQSPARTKKKTGEPLSGLCATCYVGESCEHNHAQSCASYVKAEEAKPTTPAQPGGFQPFQWVLGRDKETWAWQCDMFSHTDKNGYFRCLTWPWRYIIPYEGNEHLLGTADSPEVK